MGANMRYLFLKLLKPYAIRNDNYVYVMPTAMNRRNFSIFSAKFKNVYFGEYFYNKGCFEKNV